jgi:hypothetical protein
MKPHTYTFNYSPTNSSEILEGAIEAKGKEQAYRSALVDPRFKDATIFKSSFNRLDTPKGANRAGGLDSNGKQINARTAKQSLEAQAYKNFLKYLNLAIENLYICNMENNAAVLSTPIKQLYEEMKDYDPFK